MQVALQACMPGVMISSISQQTCQFTARHACVCKLPVNMPPLSICSYVCCHSTSSCKRLRPFRACSSAMYTGCDMQLLFVVYQHQRRFNCMGASLLKTWLRSSCDWHVQLGVAGDSSPADNGDNCMAAVRAQLPCRAMCPWGRQKHGLHSHARPRAMTDKAHHASCIACEIPHLQYCA